MKGILPSLNTPFTNSGELDLDSLTRLVEHTIISGCGGMLGLAVAGEHNTLNFDEKIQFIETVTKVNNRRIPFICSVTAADFKESVELTKSANSFGTEGICLQLPSNLEFAEKLFFLEQLEDRSPEILMIQDLDWFGDGMALEEIVKLFNSVDKFNWLKIETVGAGEKYTSVLQKLDGRLKVCGGWAVTQFIDAMDRSVNAFIPTGLEKIYVEIYQLYQNGKKEKARLLFEKILPVLNFSNQNIGTSIRFFKNLRVLEGLFESNYCRDESAVFDKLQELSLIHI